MTDAPHMPPAPGAGDQQVMSYSVAAFGKWCRNTERHLMPVGFTHRLNHPDKQSLYVSFACVNN
jgi:hypothetical protein